jgi:5-oxopent-3-ene-1,2,5-tricarboxylate decarboxylase/2-hydroxyhepta-2,4-diene-1,7-dioate isomerase
MKPPPTKIIGVHLNFWSRAKQRGRVPSVPSYFFKPPSSLAQSGDPVVRPLGTELLVFEGEIAAVIGTRTRNVAPEEGLDRIGWYAPANDFGLYDMRWADAGSNVLSKGQDGFTPLGQLIPASEVDPATLTVRASVNGRIEQEDQGANLIFSFGMLVADLSRFMTLEPGDIILTGTPAGARPVVPGDEVEVELVGLASVRNCVHAADAALAPFGAQPKVDPSTRAAAMGSNGARSAMVSREAMEVLRTISTESLRARLLRHGMNGGLIAGLGPTRPDLRLVGYASTLRYLPQRKFASQTRVTDAQDRAFESIGPEDVLVIETGRGAAGESVTPALAARAFERGAAGIVIDGGFVDHAAVAAHDIPTYYRVLEHEPPVLTVHEPVDANLPINCGGTMVMPGDIIVGDEHGVLVLPAPLAERLALEPDIA